MARSFPLPPFIGQMLGELYQCLVDDHEDDLMYYQLLKESIARKRRRSRKRQRRRAYSAYLDRRLAPPNPLPKEHAPSQAPASSQQYRKRKGRSSNVPAAGELAETAGSAAESEISRLKPPSLPVEDEAEPILRDPIPQSDAIEIEQAAPRLPPSPSAKSQF